MQYACWECLIEMTHAMLSSMMTPLHSKSRFRRVLPQPRPLAVAVVVGTMPEVSLGLAIWSVPLARQSPTGYPQFGP